MTRRLGSGSLVIATHNAGKLKEISALLEPHGMKCLSAGSLGLPEPAETGTTFVQNALLKARAAAEASGIVALADDSGLSVAALGGRQRLEQAGDFGWMDVMQQFSDALEFAQLERVTNGFKLADALARRCLGCNGVGLVSVFVMRLARQRSAQIAFEVG